MSEYWVSKKKYYCKYCEIYIADDAPSRTHHETGLRHKGNRDRFIRGLYKDGEKRKKDLDEEKREMARVEMAAQAAFSQDISAGRAKAVAPVASSSTSSSKKPPQKPSNPFADYSTAASLGYADPDAERIAAEKERHKTQGVAGTWEIVQSTSQPAQELEPSLEEKGVKRPADAPVDEDTRQFKLRKKTLGTGLGEIYDPGVITLKPKIKPAPAEDGTLSTPPTTSATTSNASDSGPKATNVPKWNKLQWKRPGERTEKMEEEEVELKNEDDEEQTPSMEEKEAAEPLEQPTGTEPTVEPKLEPSNGDVSAKTESVEPPVPPPAGGSLFRKRKAPGGGGRRQPT